MDFTTADIRTFKKLYEKHFNLDLNDETATLKLAMLVRQLEIIYQPLTKNQLKKLRDVDENNEQYQELLSA
jgi:hypothetical protein